MFVIEKEALQYIKPRSESIVIELKQITTSGGWCPTINVTGRYVPKLSVRPPNTNEQLGFNVFDQDGIKIYYSSKLKVKDGYSRIIIKLRKILFYKWLELEGVGISQ